MMTDQQRTPDQKPMPLKRLLIATAALPVASLAALMAFAAPATADTIFSSYNAANCLCGIAGSGPNAEGFTPTANYDFSGAEAFISNSAFSAQTISLALYSSVSGLPGVQEWSSGPLSVPAATGVVNSPTAFLGLIGATYSGSAIPLNDGTPYFLVVDLGSSSVVWESAGNYDAPYAFYSGGMWHSPGPSRLQFEVFGTPTSAAAIPEPASLTLLAAGFASVFAIRRRQHQYRAPRTPGPPRAS